MTTIHPKIRHVKKEDLTELVILCKEHAQYEKTEYNTLHKEQLLEECLFNDTPSLLCLVVEADKKLIGYTTYMSQFSTWEAAYYIYMDCLFLKEGWRGFGLGEKLIEEIKIEGKRLGCSLIQWQTPAFNTRAIKFYNRIGASSKTKERFFLTIN
ncbi:MAG: GNAT family N-acetyltransferase [Bacteroidetes bacterium]|nr:GNAT family N-acetyltransferase [Bacteroidota bacterium]